MRIVVIGGGIVGRLVQHRRPDARIYDWRPEPPLHQKLTLTRNYGANYLWAPIPGLPCHEFSVRTFIDEALPTAESMAAYKAKIGRKHDPPNWGQFKPVMTGYDFISLPEPRIKFGCRVLSISLTEKVVHVASEKKMAEVPYDVLISTIPLYSFLPMVGIKIDASAFPFRPIYVKVTERKFAAPAPGGESDSTDWIVNYVSVDGTPVYRQTWRGTELHTECLDTPTSLVGYKRIVPGKIFNPERWEGWRKDALTYLADRGVLTFGRFGSWETDELLHQTWAHIDLWARNLSE